MPENVKEQINSINMKSKTGLYDTHPSDKDRIKKSNKINSAGIFKSNIPAAKLFNNLNILLTQETMRHYRIKYGLTLKKEQLISTEQLIERENKIHKVLKESENFFYNIFTIYFPLPKINHVNLKEGSDSNLCIEEIKKLRKTLTNEKNEIIILNNRLTKIYERLDKYWGAKILLEAGFKINAENFGIRKGTENLSTINPKYKKEQNNLLSNNSIRMKYSEIIYKRLFLNLQYLYSKKDTVNSQVSEYRKQIESFLPIINSIFEIRSESFKLNDGYIQLFLLLNNYTNDEKNQIFINNILTCSKNLLNLMATIYNKLKIKYPFEHTEKNILISDFIMPHIPSSSDYAAEVLEASKLMLDLMNELYFRILGDISIICNQIESELLFC